MTKTFEQFHFSLIEREQPDLLEPSRKREDWLRVKFGKPFKFWHSGKYFDWVPQPYSDEFVIGVVERVKSLQQRTPPDEGATEFEGSYWTGATVVIDPRHRPDGQKVAFEDNSNVGQPAAILSSITRYLNSETSHQYALHFKPLFRGDTFYRFAEKYGGRLEYVAFKFTVPNMLFGAGTKVTDGLKRIGKDTEAQEVEVKLDSKDGVDASSKTVQEAVDYAEDGNARVTAKSLTGEYWSSTKRKMTVKMQSILNFPHATKEEVRKWLRMALDRDPDTLDSRVDIPDNRTGVD